MADIRITASERSNDEDSTLTTAHLDGAAHGTPQTATPANEEGHGNVMAAILSALEDAKAEETVVIDLTGRTALADAMVISSGRSNRHVGSIADRVVEALKGQGVKDLRVEGQPHCDWVLIDAGDVILHVFRPEVRQFYNLEKMWGTDRPGERAAS
jgi:ribosome-associated protein